MLTEALQEMIDGANSNNLFMQCDIPSDTAFRPLPEKFASRLCRRDELIVWKTMWAQGKYMDFVNYYYEKVYAPFEDEFFNRCMFAVDENDKPVATAGTWLSYGKINTVLWFYTLPEYEGRGIGRGLFSAVLKAAEFPLYVHTHPIAHRAIKLYLDFGFKFITDPVIGYRANNFQDSLPYLKENMSEKYFGNLQTVRANPVLLEAALLNELAEF